MSADTPRRPAGLLLIAFYESAKGLLFVFAAIGLLRMLHRDVREVVTHWAHLLRLDLQHHFVAGILERAGLVQPHQIGQLSALAFFMGALHLTQGIGLALKKRWAEYLTVVATGAFIPLELYELGKHMSLVRVTVLMLNVGLVAYLIIVLRGKHKESPPLA